MIGRSTVLVVIGVVVFLLGAGVVLVSLHTRTGGSAQTEVGSPALDKSAVVVATQALPPGTTGESMIEHGSVALRPVPARDRSSGDLTSIASLEQQTLIHGVGAGMPIQAGDLRVGAGALAPPSGDESLALSLPSGASGLAGYLQPGSEVDVYGNVERPSAGGHCVTLVERRVEVLDVSDEVPPYRSHPTPGGRNVPGSVTVLVAAAPAQAAKLVYYTENAQLYLAQSPVAQAPRVTGACLGLTNSTDLVPIS